MTVQPSLLFIFGIGYSAQRLAALALAFGWRVGGTVRQAEKAGALNDEGIMAEIWSGRSILNVPQGAHWLISVPPDADGCPVARAFADQAGRAASITYLSTTGVYGDLAGGWAFEWSGLNPMSERAQRRATAEQDWLNASNGQARLARLPGIYGPGRSVIERLQAGRATRIIKPGQVFSRIHVDDLSRGLLNLLEAPFQRGVFHFCDDEPAPPQDVTAYAADLLNLPAPPPTPIDAADLSPMAVSFYSECKRISNARTKSLLGWTPFYASYREGLASLIP